MQDQRAELGAAEVRGRRDRGIRSHDPGAARLYSRARREGVPALPAHQARVRGKASERAADQRPVPDDDHSEPLTVARGDVEVPVRASASDRQDASRGALEGAAGQGHKGLDRDRRLRERHRCAESSPCHNRRHPAADQPREEHHHDVRDSQQRLRGTARRLMAATVSGELLCASSLALAGLALFYARWSPEIEGAAALEKKLHKEDRYPEIQVVRRVLRTRAWPFAVAACIVAALLAPPAITIVVNAVRAIWRSPVDAFKAYN